MGKTKKIISWLFVLVCIGLAGALGVSVGGVLFLMAGIAALPFKGNALPMGVFARNK